MSNYMDPMFTINQCITELYDSITLENQFGFVAHPDTDSIHEMDVYRLDKMWLDILPPNVVDNGDNPNIDLQKLAKCKNDMLINVIKRLKKDHNDRVITKVLWSIDRCIEKGIFKPLEVKQALIDDNALNVQHPVFFKCAYKFLLKLIFFLNYHGNREVFRFSINKSIQFGSISDGTLSTSRDLLPAVDLIQVLLCREINLIPSIIIMHELKNNLFMEPNARSHKLIEPDVNRFMESFCYPTRLLYSHYLPDMIPIAGVTHLTATGFRLDNKDLCRRTNPPPILFPPSFKTSQLPLMCNVLGQFRCNRLAHTMQNSKIQFSLDAKEGPIPLATGVGLALSELIVRVMEMTEETDCFDWTLAIFEHLADVVIYHVHQRAARVNEIITLLNNRLAGRNWPKSRFYTMWFALTVTSGFIETNMLSDFVSCLRLFDILYPEAEDPESVAPSSAKRHRSSSGNFQDACVEDKEADDAEDMEKNSDVDEKEKFQSTEEFYSSTEDDISSEDSNNDFDFLQPNFFAPNTRKSKSVTRRRRRRMRHLIAAPVCQWEQVLQNRRENEDGHLPRFIPPILCPLQTKLAKWYARLNSNDDPANKLPWSKVIVTLNAYSTEVKCLSIISRLVDSFWHGSETSYQLIGDINNRTPENDFPVLLRNGTFQMPYEVTGWGCVTPLSNHRVRTISIHLLRLFYHQMLAQLIECLKKGILTSPATVETFCRISSYQVDEKCSITGIEKVRSLLQNGRFSAQIYSSSDDRSNESLPCPTENCGSVETANYFEAFSWLDILGHRLVNVMLLNHHVIYLFQLMNIPRDDFTSSGGQPVNDSGQFNATATDLPHELAYMLDWTVLKFSRSILTPDCFLNALCPINPCKLEEINDSAGGVAGETGSLNSPTSLPCSSFVSARSIVDGELLNRALLLSTLQACLAFGKPHTEDTCIKFLIDQQYAACKLTGGDNLPSIITRRIVNLRLDTIRPSNANLISRQSTGNKPFETNDSMGFSSEGDINDQSLYLVGLVLSDYATVVTSEGQVNWSAMHPSKNNFLCLILHAIMIQEIIPLHILNTLLNTPSKTIRGQIKQLCEYLIASIIKFDKEYKINPRPPMLISPTIILSALVKFCVHYHIVPIDRLILALLMRINQSECQIAAAHSIIIYLITQTPELVAAISAVESFDPAMTDNDSSTSSYSKRTIICPDLTSNRHWPRLLLSLHTILPEHSVLLPGKAPTSNSDEKDASTTTPVAEMQVFTKNPRMPIYYDHLVLRLIPVLEIVFTSFLDNPPPLLQLTRFCNTVSPLFRLHTRPLSLAYILLRGQFQQFGSTLESGTAGSGKVTAIDKICCQLIVRCLLLQHQLLAVGANTTLNRDCARFTSTSNKSSVSGLFSPSAWTYIDGIHSAALELTLKDGVMVDYSDADFVACLRAVRATINEFRLAETIAATSAACALTPAHFSSLLSPVVQSTINYGVSGTPAAWRPWRLEENVNVQAAGLYAVATELMALLCPSDSSNVPDAVASFMTCLHSHSDSLIFGSWLNVTGVLVSMLPEVFRVNIFESSCRLLLDPLFDDPRLHPFNLCTVSTTTSSTTGSGRQKPAPPMASDEAKLLRVFRRCRFQGQSGLTLFENEIKSGKADWDILGRPQIAAVNFFTDILPADMPVGQILPPHLFKAAVWHAIWRHANANQLSKLPIFYSRFISKHITNEARLLMSFFLIAPIFGILQIDNSIKVRMLTTCMYKALSAVDHKLAAERPSGDDASESRGIPLFHVHTIADLLYNIKYMYVGYVLQEDVQPMLPELRPPLRDLLKFMFPSSDASQKTQPPDISKSFTDGRSIVFEDRVYRAAKRPPLSGEDF